MDKYNIPMDKLLEKYESCSGDLKVCNTVLELEAAAANNVVQSDDQFIKNNQWSDVEQESFDVIFQEYLPGSSAEMNVNLAAVKEDLQKKIK